MAVERCGPDQTAGSENPAVWQPGRGANGPGVGRGRLLRPALRAQPHCNDL